MVSPQESVRGRRGRVDSTGSELYADHVSVALENLVGGEDPGHRAPRKQTLPRADRVVMSSFKIALRCQTSWPGSRIVQFWRLDKLSAQTTAPLHPYVSSRHPRFWQCPEP